MSTHTVHVCNRQRKVAVDRAWVEDLSRRLLDAVSMNLSRRKPPHLTRATVVALESAGDLSLTLVSNPQIRKLNREWRGKDSATDVLSFPLTLAPPPAGLPWEVGEVVISLERAREQAEALGHSFEREFSFLFVHGVLHVLGFDHETGDEEAEMFGRQKEILDSVGIGR